MDYSPQFTPVNALVGGLLLGLSSAHFLFAHGKIMGMSSLLQAAFIWDTKGNNYYSIGAATVVMGLLAGTAVLYVVNATYPDIVPFSGGAYPPPMAFESWRYAVTGLISGIGVQQARGCTSGHGINGLGRLSLRSMVAVGIFFPVGIVTATVGPLVEGRRASFGVAPVEWPRGASQWVTLLVPLFALPMLQYLVERLIRAFMMCTYPVGDYRDQVDVSRKCHSSKLVHLQVDVEATSMYEEATTGDDAINLRDGIVLPCKECIAVHKALLGLTFAVGLGVSGMTSQYKVISFLDLASGVWDPSLAFVMGGAVIPSLVANYVVKKRMQTEKCPSMALLYSTPSRTNVDIHLIIGSVLFGIGWGSSGWCPAPAMAAVVGSIVGPTQEAALFLLCMLSGIYVGRLVDRWCDMRKEGQITGRKSFLAWHQTAQHECEVCG